MASGKQKADISPVELAIQIELAQRNKGPMSKKRGYKDAMSSSKLQELDVHRIGQKCKCIGLSSARPRAKPNHFPRKVQSSPETPPRLLLLPPSNSSSRPQNQLGHILIKDEPYSSELSKPSSPAPTLNDWILGPSKLPNPKPNPIQETNLSRSQPQTSFPNAPSTSVPTMTKPRSIRKRKAAEENEHLIPTRSSTTTTKKSTNNLHCDLCQVGCSSPLTMRQHFNGRPHKAKLEWMKLKRDNSGRTIEKPSCDVCQIWCSDKDGLELHLKGQKHKAKIQELDMCGKNSGGTAVDKSPILCELCGVHCMNADLFMMHLKGRQHTLKQIRDRGY
ncbi:hypothetical protein OROMI_007973 [Orobanche minor]